MYSAVLELNDIDLRTTTAKSVASSAGFAMLGNETLMLGDEARSIARLKPLQINNRYFQQLNLVETPQYLPHARHHADLAYQHLQHVHQLAGKPDKIVFAIPANYTEQQMAVLLGIVEQCSFDAVGLVDQTVAVASQQVLAGHGVYCDIQLHQLVLGSFVVDDGAVSRQEVAVIDHGMLQLYDQWAHIIADAFIQQTRFDPLHDARVEQQIYDQLPVLLSSQAESDVFHVELEKKHRARIERQLFLAPINELLQRLLQRSDLFSHSIDHILFSQRLAGLPGAVYADPRISVVDEGTLASAIAVNQLSICTNTTSLPFITRLPLLNLASASKREASVRTALKADDVSLDMLSNVRKETSFKQSSNPRVAGLHVAAPKNSSASVAAITAETLVGGQAPYVSHYVLNGTAWPFSGAPIYFDIVGDTVIASGAQTDATVVILQQNEGAIQLQRLHNAQLLVNGNACDGDVFLLDKGDQLQFIEQDIELNLIEVVPSDAAQA